MLVDPNLLASALALGLGALALLSLNLVFLTLASRLAPPRVPPLLEPAERELPRVLVQVPLYNEGELVRRALAAIVALDWPRERLEVQVLDDSSDGSEALSRAAVAEAAAAGLDIQLIHRTRRTGYKAGALAAGLGRSSAELVAIFDADFEPAPDFLRRTAAGLAADPRLAFCQTRWGHANRGASLLTRAQARLLDGHFRVEQEARARLGLPIPFNGTCGLWRRAAIEDAGGWQGDTLTEDLDLSLRAQLRGWRAAYLGDLEVPGTLPESARAWRTQQFRWTKGFLQCALKLLPRVWASALLPTWQKPLVTLQLLQPMAFPIGLACTLAGLPFIAGAAVAGPGLAAQAVATSVIGILGTLGFMLAGTVAHTRRGAPREAVAALFLSTGLLLSNARAAAEALLGHRSEFVRTPKSPGLAAPASRSGVMELAAGLGLLAFVLAEHPVSAVYLTLVIGGLVILGLLQVLDGRGAVKPLRAGR